MAKANAEVYRIDREVTPEEIESAFEDEKTPFETHSKRVIIEKTDGDRNYHYEGEDEPPEGMSYEEDGLIRTNLTVNAAGFHHGETKVVGEGEESELVVSVNRPHMVLPFLSKEDEEESYYILIHGDNVKDEMEKFTENTSISPELVGGHYSMGHEVLSADEGHPEEDITVEDKTIEISRGTMTTTASNKEEAENLFSKAIERLKEDDNWPPELEWYRRVGQGTISVDESVELEERTEVVHNEETFYDVPIDESRNVTFLRMDSADIIVGQSKESHEDAKQALEDVNEVDGVEVELEDEGGIRDSIKFYSYK